MSTYMFITKPEYEPESVDKSSKDGWSCSKTTHKGDTIFVYVTGKGVSHIWRAVSKAEPNIDWKYSCNVEKVDDFNPPITIQELRSAIERKDWNPPHTNFRGHKSLKVPSVIASRIMALRNNPTLSPPEKPTLPLLDAQEIKFAEQVELSLEQEPALRHKRLSSAPKYPDRIKVETIAFNRNPDVAAEVLLRADGFCESCGSDAPFTRASNGLPYLEVHHVVRLADGGEDTVANTLALCPNCHRKAHYG